MRLVESGDTVQPGILACVNRLSDLLWLFGRKLERDAGVSGSLRASTGKAGNRFPCMVRRVQSVLCAALVAGRLRRSAGCANPTTRGGHSRTGQPVGANVTNGCVDQFDETNDYFPDKVAVEDADNFSVEYGKSYKIVTVHQTYLGGPSERYVLLQCGAPKPRLTGALADAPLIRVPIASLFSASTTHLPLLVDLDRLDVLTGVSKLDSIVSPPVIARIKAGGAIEFAPAGVIDAERIVSQPPSVLMTGGAESSTFASVRAAGVPVVANAEWLEPSGLGRASGSNAWRQPRRGARPTCALPRSRVRIDRW